MNAIAGALKQRRLVLSVAVLWALLGAVAWMTMPREEDPRLTGRWAIIVTPFPGADAATAERLVLEPLEERLAEVEELKRVEGTARPDVVVMTIELHGDVTDVEPVWDEIRRALADVDGKLPAGAGPSALDNDLMETESIVLAVVGSDDRLLLKNAAETLQTGLLQLQDVARVELIADPGEQVTVEYDASTARRLGVDPQLLVGLLSQRNRVIPGGSVALGGRTLSLRPGSDFGSLDELRQTPIVLPSGAAVPLEAVAAVRLEPETPARSRMRHDGEPAVALGIVPRSGIDVTSFGDAVRERVDSLRERIAPLRVEEMTFQPAYVADRLDQLGDSLLLGIAIVAGVLIFAMGLRLGLVVASVIPAVAAAGLAVYAAGGGVLHQMSISALVIALGMLVDNAIVVAESVQSKRDAGMSGPAAAAETVRELFLPLGAATGTTIAAFVPMLISEGPTGEFTRAIPLVIMLTLGASYLFAVFVTPILAGALLRGRSRARETLLSRVAGALGAFAVRRRGLVLLAAFAVVAASVLAVGQLRQQFFPASDRAIVVIDVELPEGAHLDTTDAVLRGVEEALDERPDVVRHASFAGRSVPHFYYNLPFVPSSPQFGQVVAFTTDRAAVEDLIAWVPATLQRRFPEAELLARALEQGPPVRAPIEIRLYGDDLGDLQSAVEQVLAVVRHTSGARDVRHDIGVGAPTLSFRVDDAAAARSSLARSDVALALLQTTRGLPAGELRAGDDPVPIRVRATAGEDVRVDELQAIDVGAAGRPPVPLVQVATPTVQWRPAAIHRRDRSRIATVTAQLAPGVTFSEVLATLRPELAALTLPPGVRHAFGGELEGAGEANSSLLTALPVGLLLLLVMLLVEFNSFRRVGIVLVTVPLAAAGVVPGLLFTNQPFGFMSLLGVFALIGIVVNNAIVLLDVIERRRAEGHPIPAAIVDAVRARTRPILLTTATTVAGLLPLALSDTTLWPPMAWAMISGLLASTLLTLAVVPALYAVLFRDRPVSPEPLPAAQPQAGPEPDSAGEPAPQPAS